MSCQDIVLEYNSYSVPTELRRQAESYLVPAFAECSPKRDILPVHSIITVLPAALTVEVLLEICKL